MADPSKDTQTKSGSPAGRVPAYLALAGEIEAKIRSGELRPGSQLPPQRDLAQERSVNVSTVTRAYRELQNLNLVVGSTRRGTIVTSEGVMPRVDRAATPAGVIDLTVNRPAVDDFCERLAEALPNLAVDIRFRELQEYQPPEGPAWARRAGQRWIALNGFEPAMEDVVVTSGAQHALLAVVSSLIEPGDVIASDRLTYYGLKALAQMFRFRVVGIGSDEQGMSAEELARACRAERVKAVFTVPSMHNPSVVTMSETRRRELVEIAERYDLTVIEDDVYGPMLGSRPPAIATLLPERTYHISSLSKALAPGLRVGYLSCPPGRAVVAAEAVRTTAWMPAPLPLLVASSLAGGRHGERYPESPACRVEGAAHAGNDHPRRSVVQRRPTLHVHLAEIAGAVAGGGLRRQRARSRRRGDAIRGLCQRQAASRARRQGERRLRVVARGACDSAAYHRRDARGPPASAV